MFCPKCGNEIVSGAKFCGKCGTMLSSGGQKPSKGSTGEAPAGKAAGGIKLPNGMKAPGADEIKDSLRKVSAEAGKAAAGAGKAAGQFGLKMQSWLSVYVDKWRGLKQMGNREKGMWLGIHGGAVFLLICVMVVSAVTGGHGDSSTKKLNVENLLQEVMEDGDITEEDILNAAGQIHSHEDWKKLSKTFYEKGIHEENRSYLSLNFPLMVAVQCREMSAMGMLVKEYQEWYDGDGLTEKLFGKSDQVAYIMFYDSRIVPLVNGEVPGKYSRLDTSVYVTWYAYPDSDEITIQTEEDGTTNEYVAKFEGSGTEFIITLDGKKYHFSEAATGIAKQKEESFESMAGGTWKFDQGFYNMIAANLGDWEKYKGDIEPLYIEFFGSGHNDLMTRGVDGVFAAHVKGYKCEQGEGKTVTFFSKSSSVEATYDKRGENLVITVNGTDYVLTPTTIVLTGTYSEWGTKN